MTADQPRQPEELENLLIGRRVGAYVGIDPTAPSMHLGHMVPFMALAWFYVHGYSATFLLGGATARVGDPEGRLTARTEMKKSERLNNLTSMHMQLKKLGQNIETYARRFDHHREWVWKRALVNNNQFYQKLNLMDFLRGPASVGRMGPMLGRDSVKRRLKDGDGMSVAEFVYPLMQAWDWYKLFQQGTQIQIGGADQFGNILEGANTVKKLLQVPDLEEKPVQLPDEPTGFETEVFGRRLSNDPMGFTVPLMTTSSGEKFGKSAGNAIWLDPDMTSSFELYQYFLRLPDADVERFLLLFTFLPIPEIQKIMEDHTGNESKRLAQHTLAYEFVYLVHGRIAAETAKQQHEEIFSRKLSFADLKEPEKSKGPPGEINPSVNKYAPQTNANNNSGARIKLPRSLVEGQHLHKVLWSAGMVATKSEGHRLAASGGAHIGSRLGQDPKMSDHVSWTPIKDWTPADVSKYLLDEGVLLLRIGKWKVKVVEIVSDNEYEELGLSCPGWKEDPFSEPDDWKKASQERAEWIAERKRRKQRISDSQESDNLGKAPNRENQGRARNSWSLSPDQSMGHKSNNEHSDWGEELLRQRARTRQS